MIKTISSPPRFRAAATGSSPLRRCCSSAAVIGRNPTRPFSSHHYHYLQASPPPSSFVVRHFSAHVWYRAAITSERDNYAPANTEVDDTMHHSNDHDNNKQEPPLSSPVQVQAPETALGTMCFTPSDLELATTTTDDDDDNDTLQLLPLKWSGARLSSSSSSWWWWSSSWATGSSDTTTTCSVDTTIRNNNNHTSQEEEQRQSPLSQPQRPLPKTLQQVLKDSRPCVVTQAMAPFAIVDVNDAWVGLCGYTKNEAIGQSLAHLLHGPQTDTAALQTFVRTLLEEQEQQQEKPTGVVATAQVVNYTKSGRKFRNLLRGGRIRIDTPSPTDRHSEHLLVGVLQEVGEA